jgi:multiple sugar transport system ATP-binding protein
MLLHKRLGATMLYVTHDQTEALTLADRIVCMSMGHVQQIGTPLELYDNPANLFVASFIGLPPMNFFEVLVSGDKLIGPHFEVEMNPEQKDLLASYQGKHITLGVRPENVVPGGTVPVKVSKNENLGMNTLVHGHIDGVGTEGRIVCKFRGWCEYKNGDNVLVSFDKMHFFDKETTNAIVREAQ